MVDNSDGGVLRGEELARALADVYEVVGPLYRRVYRRVERDAPIEGVSLGVRAVLERIDAHGRETVPQIGRALALSRQFVQRMVNDAAAAGYVELQPNPAHRRSSLVALTEAGREAIAAVKAREYAALGRVGDGAIARADVEATLRVLRQLLAAVEEVSVE